MAELSDAGKRELALALILWRDFKSEGLFDVEVVTQMLGLADHVGVRSQVEEMLSQVPPMEIRPRGG